MMNGGGKLEVQAGLSFVGPSIHFFVLEHLPTRRKFSGKMEQQIQKISKFRYLEHYPYFHLADLAPDWTNPGSQLNEHFVPAGWLPTVHFFGLTWETKISKSGDVSTSSERPT